MSVAPAVRPWLAAALCLLAGCASSRPSSFYLLAPLAVAPDPPPEGDAARVHLEALELAEYLARDELVTRVGRNGLELATFERWGEPLRDSIARVVAADLALLLGGASVTRHPWERPAAPDAVLLSLAVERFEAERDEPGGPIRVVLVARWRFAGAFTGEQSGSWTLAVSGEGTADVVHAMSAALGYLSRAIAAALPAHSSMPPALSALVPLAARAAPSRRDAARAL